MPGGWQLISSYDDKLYVLMDERPADTHKYPSGYVWVYDLSEEAVVQKIALEMPAQSLMVTL
ncbi:MAG: amine dehydrogenase large subunit [Deinococcales bacterium]